MRILGFEITRAPTAGAGMGHNGGPALEGQPKASGGFDVSNLSPEQLREFLRIGGGHETASGAMVNDTAAMKVGVFWRSTQIISGAISGMASDLVLRESEAVRRPAVGHSLRRVLTVKPNQWQTPGEFKRLLQTHLLVRGNAYALKVMLRRDVVALIPMNPDRVRAEQLDNGKMEYLYTRKNGAQERLRQEQVMHLRGMSLDGITGLSPISFMRESLGLALQGERAAAKVMKNGQFTAGVIEHPEALDGPAVERLRASVDTFFSGADNAGRWMILEEGMAAKPLAMNAKDMEFIGLRDFQRYDIAMFMGVPPFLVGLTEKSTSWGSGIEQQGIGFQTYTLNDWLTVWQEAVKRDLLPEEEWETHDFRFYPLSLLRSDSATRWANYVHGLQWGVYSPNQVLAFEDLPPREGGDVFYQPPNASGNAAGDGGDNRGTP